MKTASTTQLMRALLVMLFFLLSNVITFAQKLPFTIESGVIPPNFNQNNDTLLVISTQNPMYNMSMKKHFKKNYTGNFLMVKEKNLDDYSINTCRYVFSEGMINTKKYTIGGPFDGSRNVVTHDDFVILDRKTNTIYKNPNPPSVKLIKGYIAALDEARMVPIK